MTSELERLLAASVEIRKGGALLVPDLSRGAYDSHKAEHFSGIKWFARSPAHFLWHETHPVEDTAAMRRGRVVHLAVLEPTKFRETVVQYNGIRRGAPWEDFKACHPGMEILKPDEYAEAKAIADAVFDNPLAAQILAEGRAELSMFWEQDGVRLKGRVDWESPDSLADLKVCNDASPAGFGRAVVNFHLAEQAAIYGDGHAACTRARKPFKFICVEPAPPYAVAVYSVRPEIEEYGREKYLGWLERLAECRKANDWPSYSSEVMALTLPAWALPRNEDEDVSEMGLTFNAGE